MKKIYWIAAMLILVIGLVGCSSSDSGDSSNDEPDAAENETENKEETSDTSASNEELGIGDTVSSGETTIGTYDITLDSAEITDEVEGETASKGTFVITNLTIENTGEEALNMDDVLSTLSLFNSERSGDVLNVLVGDMEAQEGEVEPGDSATGELYYDTEKADRYGLEMTYVSPEGELKKARWNFDADEAE
ncbi:DUF4352 domain-containing protein [Thalassobacillus hwangdonensis]|uniref:DUF4352 domain-containing protein n=1 Tax=Thalassobacillus hwangdonensis TaxID=546108 RepID=A0ABW3L2S9_9BACI